METPYKNNKEPLKLINLDYSGKNYIGCDIPLSVGILVYGTILAGSVWSCGVKFHRQKQEFDIESW